MQIYKGNKYNTYVRVCLDTLTQPTFTCPESTMKTPEQCVKSEQ